MEVTDIIHSVSQSQSFVRLCVRLFDATFFILIRNSPACTHLVLT